MIATTARKIADVGAAVVRTSIRTTRDVAAVIGSGVGKITRSSRDAGSTVTGQARSAAERTADQVSKNVREVTGQARAQGRATAERVDDIVEQTGKRAANVVEDKPSVGTPYEQWTKDELYERATELDVGGRSGMNKQQLIDALRAA